jgi:hypothetical protein
MSYHPTINIFIDYRYDDPSQGAFVDYRSGWQAWHWEPYQCGPVCEVVLDRSELIKALRTYGLCASRLTGGAHVRVTARGRFGHDRWLGEQEWAGGAPLGEPSVHFPAWESIPFAAQLVVPRYWEHDDHKLIDTGELDVATLRFRLSLDEPGTAGPGELPGEYTRGA